MSKDLEELYELEKELQNKLKDQIIIFQLKIKIGYQKNNF